ncbi:hypothetical protein EA004_19040 [Vibrio anguillarum]|uniref:DUF4199 domain-containing protein n=2 Tax=Vibrio anguillarum TaxID=55601 RepID=A0ABR9ZBH5_VIBAN|nr:MULTISPECIES: hypothetical protein [Vibrio]MBE3671231.1 hypothetical protein [Vibrio navarrensis]MBF4247086.1 hypothetical protein [Vibrio anguillarum]MBF4375459.1 hypothetical protein [Vibrio anguillarum]
MSKEKIPNPIFSVSLTLICIIGLPLYWWFFLDFPMDKMSDQSARKFAQIGATINLIAGLSMIIRFLWLNRYKKRLEHIYQIDDLIVSKYEFLKHNTYDEKTKETMLAQFKKEQAPLYKELDNYLKFNKVESIHMVIGIAGLFFGTLFQIIGAG